MTLETMTIADVPLMRVGEGFMGQGCPEEGCAFTEADLDAIVMAYWATKDGLLPPVKLGHDDEQALLEADGLPMAGIVANLRRRGGKLYADLLDVPKKVGELIKAGAYRAVSVELGLDFKVGEQKFPKIIKGLALLGADLPAIDSLGGITALYHSLQLSVEEGDTIILAEINDKPAIKEPETVQTSPEGQEVTMDEQAIRQALGLDDDKDIVAAISALKAQATDISTGEKGAENRLAKELAEAQRSALADTSQLTQRVLELENKVRLSQAEGIVDTAIHEGRILPKDRGMSVKLAMNDPEGFQEFAKSLRVDLNERGRMQDANAAAIEPTREELDIAKQMGISREALMAQKAKDLGIALS